MQALELVIFAGLAAIVLYQLYAVLGRRVGRQPGETQAPEPRTMSPKVGDGTPDTNFDGVPLTGLAAVKATDPSFDVAHFLAGAKAAYQLIVKAFAAGDREALRNLLAPRVYASFEEAITQREAEGRSETVEFVHAPRADLEKLEVQGASTGRITVRFLAEFRSRAKGPEGESVDDRRTAELWTFERDLRGRDPNWSLVQVDAAEA